METSSSSDRSYAAKSMLLSLPVLDGWREWVPTFSIPEHPDVLIDEAMSALAWVKPSQVVLVRYSDVAMLNNLDLAGLNLCIREVFCHLLPHLGADQGFLMRAQVGCLYPGASARGLWEALLSAPAQITARSSLEETIRLLLFYATVFTVHGNEAELARLEPTLNLCRRGFLPLGLDKEHRVYLVIG